MRRRGPGLGEAARFRDEMPYHRFQVAGLLIDAQLTLRAGAVFENRMDVFDGAAAAEIVHDVIHEFEQLEGELAHGDFGLFAEIDELAFDTVARGAPFVFFDQGAAVESVTLIAFVEAMEFYDDSLRERGDGYGFFDFGGHIEHAEFESAKHGVRANVPPDFFSIVDAVEFYQKIDEIFIGTPGF